MSISKSEAMVLSWKRVDCPLQGKGELLPLMEEFKYLRFSFTSEGKMEIDRRIGAATASDADAEADCCGEEIAEPEGKAFNFNLFYNPHAKSHLWSRALGSD